jgi:ribonuclease HII
MNEYPMSENAIIAGIDDATKCPCIGSIFVAGVIADEKTIEEWKQLGVKDSKLIAAKKRESLAKIIKKTALGYSIQHMPPNIIDDKSFNLNEWEMLTVLKIMGNLQRFGNPENVYIDNWETSEKGFRGRLKAITDLSLKAQLLTKKIRLNRKKLSLLTLTPEHRADENYIIVGAASILAKTASDAQYRRYKKQYGDFGSGSPADPQTRLFVWQHRHNPLPIIRTLWNTYKTLSVLESIEDDPIYARVKNKHNGRF